MLIDLVPDPGPGPRGPRDSSARGTAAPDGPSFDTIFARTAQVGSREVQAPVETTPDPVPESGDEVDPLGTDPVAMGSEAETPKDEMPPRGPRAEGDASADPRRGQAEVAPLHTVAVGHMAGSEGPKQPTTSGETIRDPALGMTMGDRTSMLPLSASGSSDAPRGQVVQSPGDEPVPGMGREVRSETGRAIDPQTHGAAKPTRLSVEALLVAEARRADPASGPAAGAKIPEPVLPNPTEPYTASAAERTVPPAPAVIPGQLQTAMLAEARQTGLRSTDASLRAGIEAGLLGFGLGTGEGNVTHGMGETFAERVLRPAGAAGAELAREIAQQIGARITPLARGQFELMLAPAELGRLEIVLREVDGVMTLSINAERPETLDLIRRHVDLLAQELRQLSQRELTLQWGMGGSGPGGGNNGQALADVPRTAPADPASRAAAAPAATGLSTDHLDLRL